MQGISITKSICPHTKDEHRWQATDVPFYFECPDCRAVVGPNKLEAKSWAQMQKDARDKDKGSFYELKFCVLTNAANQSFVVIHDDGARAKNDGKWQHDKEEKASKREATEEEVALWKALT